MTETVADNSAVTTEATPGAVVFDAPRWPLIRLLIKNLLLGLVTLGMYRFWAKTNVRRYFWRHVSIAGEPLEYTGRGKELFLGFLIVLAVLVPVFGAIQALAFALVVVGPGANLALQLVLVVTLAFLMQVAVFRMRRYRLTRTVWRGIRCGLDGSSLRYALAAFCYTALVPLTLGMSYPWMRVALSRRLVGQMRFGGQSFAFDAKARDLFAAWVIVLLGGLVTIAIVVGIAYHAATTGAEELTKAAAAGRPQTAQQVGLPWWTIVVALVGYLLTLILYARYRVYEFRYFVQSATLGETSFSCELRTRSVIGLVVVYALLVIAAVAIYLLVISFAFGTLFSIGEGLELSGTAPIIAAVSLLVLLGVISILRTAWLRFGLVDRISRSFGITNLAAVEAVIQSSEPTPKRGEGLADALDVGDF